MITGSIVTYKNSFQDLEKVISSFLASKGEIKLYISDNSPTDIIKELCIDSRIEYFHNSGNFGFGKAHNIAIKKAIADGSNYHVVLNPDIYFAKDVLKKLKCFMDKNEDVGLSMPKVKFPDGSTQYLCKLLPTPFTLLVRRFLPNWKWVKKIDYKYEMRFTEYNKVMNVPYLSGCFMFIRSKIFDEIGFFDENIFMYLEDTDLTRRIHKKYKTVMNPEVEIFHKWEKGSYKNKKLMFYNIKAALYYFYKYGFFFDSERRKINRKVIEEFSNGI